MGGREIGSLLRSLTRDAAPRHGGSRGRRLARRGKAQLALGIAERGCRNDVRCTATTVGRRTAARSPRASDLGVRLAVGEDTLLRVRRALEPFGVPVARRPASPSTGARSCFVESNRRCFERLGRAAGERRVPVQGSLRFHPARGGTDGVAPSPATTPGVSRLDDLARHHARPGGEPPLGVWLSRGSMRVCKLRQLRGDGWYLPLRTPEHELRAKSRLGTCAECRRAEFEEIHFP